MTLIKRLGIFTAVAILIASAWIWWNRPRQVDMARYAPSDSLVYVECNGVLNIGEALVNTKAWRELSPLIGPAKFPLPGSFLRRVMSWTGIGPAPSVILARAQVAAVMVDLGAIEKGQTLTVKPELAILIETHTSEARIRPVVENALNRFAESAYPGAQLRRHQMEGAEFIVWNSATAGRQIAATIVGSLVIVGNSENAVRTCLNVHRGLRPSLSGNAELHQMRNSLGADQSLAFGFVSSSNAARLAAATAPILLGMSPGDTNFERLLAGGASKLLSGVGWSSRAVSDGVEDRYLFTLDAGLVSGIRPSFHSTEISLAQMSLLPGDTYSLSVYRFEEPLAVWRAFQTAVSSRLDTLSAIVFTTLFKSGLASYGIDEPEKFLSTVGPEIITARLTPDSEKPLLIARIRDETALRQFLSDSLRFNKEIGDNQLHLVDADGQVLAVGFSNQSVLIGQPHEVRKCLEGAAAGSTTTNSKRFDGLQNLLQQTNPAEVVTSTNDRERVIDFVRSVARVNGNFEGNFEPTDSPALINKLDALAYSTSRTTLAERGFERTTLSPFGQFGAFVALLVPDN